MSAEREKMIAALKSHVLPVLRTRGFKGSFPHFRRASANGIHLLTFQFDKWGGGFIVEVASCPTNGITMHWGEQIPPEKVTAQHISRALTSRSVKRAERPLVSIRQAKVAFIQRSIRERRTRGITLFGQSGRELLERITRITVWGLTWTTYWKRGQQSV